jgi:hypothetical protein
MGGVGILRTFNWHCTCLLGYIVIVYNDDK